MQRAIEALPRPRGFDQTRALLREGYGYISTRCDALGSDAFATRLMLRPVICLRGAEAAEVFYDGDRFTRRNGAMPPTVLRLLQDKGSVQQLDAAAHRHRKAMFVELLMDEARVDAFTDQVRVAWFEALPGWSARGEVVLFDVANRVLTTAIRRWMGIPEAVFDDRALCADLVSMVENTGRFGPGVLAALWRRRQTEKQIQALVAQVRTGRLKLDEEAPLQRVACHQDRDGHLLSPEAATVEIINILRPAVAIGRNVLFSAMALEAHPEWKTALPGADDILYDQFAEEVRRLYPFFPFIGGIVREDFCWKGHRFVSGDWVLLDIYGTNRDPATFSDPAEFAPERDLSWRAQDHRFIPQGGGDAHHTHRCPGEAITVAAMREATRLLVEETAYEVAGANHALPPNRIPARPDPPLVLSNVRRKG